jgi:hypothetical protein
VVADAGQFSLERGKPFTQYSGAMSLCRDVSCGPEQCDSENCGDHRADVERALERVAYEHQDGKSRCHHPPSDCVRHAPGALLRPASRACNPGQQAFPNIHRVGRVHGPRWRKVEGGQQRVLHLRERTCALPALPEVDEESCPLSPGQQGKAELDLLVLSIERVHWALSRRMDNFSLSF